MTLQEFKAWFEGFSEGIDGVPTEKQWAKIKKRVSEIGNVGSRMEGPFVVKDSWRKLAEENQRDPFPLRAYYGSTAEPTTTALPPETHHGLLGIKG